MSLAPAEINIKNHIIKYPDLFQSRLAVLKFVLFTDPASCWSQDGTVYSRDISGQDVANPKLNTSSLPDVPKELAALCAAHVTPMQVHREIELAKYQVIEKHLDTIVKASLPNEIYLTAADVRQINQYSLIFQIPDNVEASWLSAVREVLQVALIATKQEYCKHRCDGSHVDHWVYPFAFETYQKLVGQQQRFIPTITVSTETAEKLKKIRSLLG